MVCKNLFNRGKMMNSKISSLLFFMMTVFVLSSGNASACPFNEQDYLNLNPDVYAAVARGVYTSGHDHYIHIGYTEGRRINYQCNDNQNSGPDIQIQPAPNAGCAFDEQAYLSFNPDVYAAVGRGVYSSGYDHYIHIGYTENRRISYNCGGEQSPGRGPDRAPDRPNRTPERGPDGSCLFDEQAYLDLNRDVYAAVSRGEYRSGYEHYKLYGYRENRQISYNCGGEEGPGRGPGRGPDHGPGRQPPIRIVTEECQVSRLDPAGMFIQSYIGSATGPENSDVIGLACSIALKNCSVETRGRQTCNVAR